MRPRLFASAAAALSAALAAAAEPLPLPSVGEPPVAAAPALPPIPNVRSGALPTPGTGSAGNPALPAVPVPGTRPNAPNFLPALQPEEKLSKPVPKPRKPGDPAPSDSPAPATDAPMAMPTMPRDKSIHDDHLGPWNTVWVRGGYDHLWIKDAPSSPTLLATGSAGSGRSLLGGPNTNAPYGGYNGASASGGIWLNERHTFGLGFSGFITEQRSNVSSYASDALGSPALVRPFFNPQNAAANAQDSFIVSSPGQFAGSLAVEHGARVDGFDINLLMNVCNTKSWTANFAFGMRYFDLDEYQAVYQVTQSLMPGNGIPFFGQTPVNGAAITDRFHSRNQFYGTQFGGDAEYRLGPLFFDLGLKAAIGPVHQVTEVSGQTVVPGGAGGTGGFLAVGAYPNGNQGRLTTNTFAVLTDLNTAIGVQVSNHLRIGVGYQFLYLNSVARPTNQIVATIDPRLVPTSNSFGGRIPPSSTLVGGPGTPPNSPFDRGDFFVHGLRLMFEVQY